MWRRAVGITVTRPSRSLRRASATMEFLAYRAMPTNLMKEVLAAEG